MHISLRQLKHLIALTEEGSYTKAAQQVHLTQSALSRSIQELELGLGLRLLDRTPGGVSLTQAGQAMHFRIERILSELAALKRDAITLRSHDADIVRFGAGVFPGAAFLSPLLQQLAMDYPHICAHVEIESWQRLINKLDQEKLDFVVAITHSLPPSSNYQTRPLAKQMFGLFVRAGHPLLMIPKSRMRSKLINYGLATTDLPVRARQRLVKVYGLTNIEQLPIRLECDNVNALVDVVLASDTILLSTHQAILAQLESRKLIKLPIEYFASAGLTCSIIHHAGRTLTPAVETVINMIQKIMPETHTGKHPKTTMKQVIKNPQSQ